MPSFAYTLFLEGLIPIIAAIMIFVTARKRGTNRRLLSLAWLLFFAGLFSLGLSLPSAFAAFVPGFVLTTVFVTFISLACHAALYLGLAGYCGNQGAYAVGRKVATVIIVTGLVIGAGLLILQGSKPGGGVTPGSDNSESAATRQEEGEKAHLDEEQKTGQVFHLEAVESNTAKFAVLGYLTIAFLFVAATFAYQAWHFRKERAAFVYTASMSLGIGMLMLTWILREIIESTAPHLGIDVLSFLSLGIIVAAVIFQTSLAMSPGLVFDSRTMKPIELATVRIFRAHDNKLLETRITAKDGRYGLMPEPGTYYLDVVAQGYSFPSMSHSGYRKEIIDVAKPKLLGFEIPIDPVGTAH